MRGQYPFEQRYWYPNLSPAEAAIWHKFIAEFPDVYDSVDYNVKLGSVPDFIKNDPEAANTGTAGLYQYKIDCIGYKGDQVDIIELKQSATMRALGQVNGYRELYVRDFPGAVIPKTVVITDALMPDMGHLAATAGVQLVVV